MLGSGNPFGINLRSRFSIIARDGIQVAVNCFVVLVRQYGQAAQERVAEESLLEPMDSQATNGMPVHKRFVGRLHGYTEVRPVVDMAVEIQVDRIDPVLYLPERRSV